MSTLITGFLTPDQDGDLPRPAHYEFQRNYRTEFLSGQKASFLCWNYD